MPTISNIEILQRNEQPTLSIRTRTSVENEYYYKWSRISVK